MHPPNQQSRIKKPKSKIPLQARLIRRTVRRFIQSVRFGSLEKSPILFANSFPKSGTHLLTQVLKGFTKLGPVVDSGLPAVTAYDGYTGRQRSEEEILSDLNRLLPGDIAYGHVHSFPEALAFLSSDGVAAYFILRDPRDVVVSHVHYVVDMAPNHIHHRYYRDTLNTLDERIRASIVGVSSEQLSTSMKIHVPEPLPSIWARFEPYLGWLDHPQVMVLHYEDFIKDCWLALDQVLNHAIFRGFSSSFLPEKVLDILGKSITPKRSPTYRSGKVGSWRDEFQPEHKLLFKQVTGDLLLQLGYEESADW